MKFIVLLVIGFVGGLIFGLNLGNKIAEDTSLALLDQTLESGFDSLQMSFTGSNLQSSLQNSSSQFQAILEEQKEKIKQQAKESLRVSLLKKINEMFK